MRTRSRSTVFRRRRPHRARDSVVGTDGPELADALEVSGRVVRVRAKQLVVLVGDITYLAWQGVVERSKFAGGVVLQNFLARPDLYSASASETSLSSLPAFASASIWDPTPSNPVPGTSREARQILLARVSESGLRFPLPCAYINQLPYPSVCDDATGALPCEARMRAQGPGALPTATSIEVGTDQGAR